MRSLAVFLTIVASLYVTHPVDGGLLDLLGLVQGNVDKTSEGVGEILEKAVKGVNKIAKGAVDNVTDGIGGILKGVRGTIEGAINQVLVGYPDGIKEMINKTLNRLLSQVLRKALRAASTGVSTGIAKLINRVKSKVDTATFKISHRLSNDVGGFMNKVNRILKRTSGTMNSASDKIQGVVTKVLHDVIHRTDVILDKIINNIFLAPIFTFLDFFAKVGRFIMKTINIL